MAFSDSSMTHVTQRKDNSRTKDATKRKSERRGGGGGKTQKPNYDLFLGFGALPTDTERERETASEREA